MDKKLTVNVKVEKQKDINIKVIPEKAIKIKADGIKYVKPNFDDATAETDNVLMGKTFYSRGSSKKQTGTLNPQDFATILSISLNGTEILPDEDKNVNIEVTKETAGLGNVDNTSDIDKPISTAQQEEFDKINTRLEEELYIINKDFENLDNKKVDKVEGKDLSENDFTNYLKNNLETLIEMKNNDQFGKVDDIRVNDNTIVENKIANIKLSNSLENNSSSEFASAYLINLLNKNKVDKIDGKGLSTNDFTNELKTKLENLENYDDTNIKNEINELKISKANQEDLDTTNNNLFNLESRVEINETDISNLKVNKANKTDVVFNNFDGTQNITSNIALKGDLNITGNIIQNGSAYETHAEKVYTKNDYIITRDGAVSGLGNGEFTGILAKKYDGSNDGHLVFDNQGIARVGDVGDEQPLATREETPIENGFANWDNTTKKFITKLISSSDLTDKDSIAYKTDLKAYLPLAGGQLTGALKIAKGTGNGIQNYDGTPLLYIDNYDDLYIRNDSGTEIHLGMAGEHIQIGGNKVLSDTNVVGHSFTFNDKSVAVTSDIPKTLNNKTLVANGNTTIYGTDITLASDNTSNVTDAINNANTRIDNLTTTVNGKADISAIPTALSQLSEDTTHRVVTDTEKATWNAKSNFDGNYDSLTNKPVIPTNADFTLAGLKEKSYNSLTDKPTIPTKTSQLTNDSNFATTSQIPDTSGFVPNTRTINSKALSSNISLSNKDVGALPDYTINISHQTAGNPRIVKFVSVNYASAATCFKMGAMTCHNNGSSYQFLTDMLITVTTGGVVTANIYKFAQSSIGSVDGVARYTGDVFYVNDTTNKIVDFYILCGQYSESQFTPVTKVGSTTIAYVTQYSGTATYYSSGDKTWANGCGTTYARLSDIPTKTSQLTNDSGFATTSQLNNKVNYSDIVQSTGTNTNNVMSQNAVTTELGNKAGLSTNNTFTGNNKYTYLQYFNGGIMVDNIWTISTDGSGNLMFIKH